MLTRFYWLVDGELAGCSRPGGPHVADARLHADSADSAERYQMEAASLVEHDLRWLRRQGIRAVLSLTETPLPADALDREGLIALHLPIPNLTAPTPAQFARALGFVDRQRSLGHPVVVHCLAGQGRTGSILAAHLIRIGVTSDDALQTLRGICPGAVDNRAQEQALHAYARRRDWIL